MYSTLITNIPALAMTFSDMPYGPKSKGKQYVHRNIVREYLEDYYRSHGNMENVELGVTVEEMSKVGDKWRLVLRKRRKREDAEEEDYWWEERFDAVVLANGHYHIPFVSCPACLLSS